MFDVCAMYERRSQGGEGARGRGVVRVARAASRSRLVHRSAGVSDARLR